MALKAEITHDRLSLAGELKKNRTLFEGQVYACAADCQRVFGLTVG